MITNIFDSHAHYCDEKFDADRAELLASLHQNGVKAIFEVGNDMPSTRAGIRLAEQFGFVYCSVGVHPHEASSVTPEHLEELAVLAKRNKVCAIGEIGLDYHYDFSPRDIQQKVFEEQLILAKELDMPVIVHNRESHEDTMRLLKKYRPKGIVHCFSGSAEMATELVKMGMYIGFTGVVTFKNARRALESAKAVPLDRILIETDCPYMAPEPYRGQRCDSSMLGKTIETLAGLRGISPQQFAEVTCENACAVYGISL